MPWYHVCFLLLLPGVSGCGAKDKIPESPMAGAADSGADGDTDSGSDVTPGDSGSEGGVDSGEATPGDGDDTGGEIDLSATYNRAYFRASHNSYSGGERGTLVAQLDAGVRQIELDFHDNDYEEQGFRVGHGSPGSEVDHSSPNPASDSLEDWMMVVSDWSLAHPGHAPIHLQLNIKDDMTDNRHTGEGSLAALNSLLLDVLSGRLFWARNLEGDWPTVDSLRDKFVVGLTGVETMTSRVAYVRDKGRDPAVAINDHGQIIEVHQSELHDSLWYWTGQLQDDGSVIWWHHGRYDNGRSPAIALNNNGVFVEVHRSQTDDDLWYWSGSIGPDGDLQFLENREFDSGVAPSIRFTDLEANTLREIHTSDSDESVRWDWLAEVDPASGLVAWGAHGTTADEAFDTDTASAEAGEVSVASATHGASGANTLVYTTPTSGPSRIRYAQIAFIDTSWGDLPVLTEASRFRSFPSGDHVALRDWTAGGGIGRMWHFSESDAEELASSPPNFGATDEPLSAWYNSWAVGVGVSE